MSRLILMRHGQASFGAEKYDALSETGQAQARATGDWFRSQPVLLTQVVHGPRRRQADTASLLVHASGTPLDLNLHAGLDEFAEGEEIFRTAESFLGRAMSAGPARSQREVLRDYDSTCQAWGAGQVMIAGRGCLTDFRTECRQWLHTCTRDNYSSGRQVLAVTSAGVIAALVCEVMNLPDASWTGLLRVIRNASLTEILYTDQQLSLLSFNSISHLPPGLNTSM